MVEPTAVNRVVVGSSPTRGANLLKSRTIKKQLLKNPVNNETCVSNKCLWDFFLREYIMKTVTICGSMKFVKEMQSIAFLLEARHNVNVLQCVYNVDDLDITVMERVSLENAHYRKIELSDAIYVVDLQGYIGNQVSKEIEFAKSKGKEIIFHSEYGEI